MSTAIIYRQWLQTLKFAFFFLVGKTTTSKLVCKLCLTLKCTISLSFHLAFSLKTMLFSLHFKHWLWSCGFIFTLLCKIANLKKNCFNILLWDYWHSTLFSQKLKCNWKVNDVVARYGVWWPKPFFVVARPSKS